MTSKNQAASPFLDAIQMYASGCSQKPCPRYDLEVSFVKKKLFFWGYENVRKSSYQKDKLRDDELEAVKGLLATCDLFSKSELSLGAWLKRLKLTQLPRPYVAMSFLFRSKASKETRVIELFQLHGLSMHEPSVKRDQELTRLESECARMAVDRRWV
jgi:hypothetical protein